MKKHIIHFHPFGLADFKKLPKNVRNHLKKPILDKLVANPLGCSEPLQPPLERYRSCHVEQYRIVFYIAEDIQAVAIMAVGEHDPNANKDIYKRLEALARTGKLAEKILAAIRGITQRREK